MNPLKSNEDAGGESDNGHVQFFTKLTIAKRTLTRHQNSEHDRGKRSRTDNNHVKPVEKSLRQSDSNEESRLVYTWKG